MRRFSAESTEFVTSLKPLENENPRKSMHYPEQDFYYRLGLQATALHQKKTTQNWLHPVHTEMLTSGHWSHGQCVWSTEFPQRPAGRHRLGEGDGLVVWCFKDHFFFLFIKNQPPKKKVKDPSRDERDLLHVMYFNLWVYVPSRPNMQNGFKVIPATFGQLAS